MLAAEEAPEVTAAKEAGVALNSEEAVVTVANAAAVTADRS
jgi:hypothetical protein